MSELSHKGFLGCNWYKKLLGKIQGFKSFQKRAHHSIKSWSVGLTTELGGFSMAGPVCSSFIFLM